MLTHYSISQQGRRHMEHNVPCQDFSESKRVELKPSGFEIVIAAVADGVGSCEFSQIGAQVAVNSFVNSVEYNLLKNISELTDEAIEKLLVHAFHYALFEVEKAAEEQEVPFIELDSTLTGIIYDGHNLWFGHIGDDGIVALYSDGEYEMITSRHKGEEAGSLFPLRDIDTWQFGKASKEVSSCVLMTDGVLDYCVDSEVMNNRVLFPFLEPALTEAATSEAEAEKLRQDWDEYLSGRGTYKDNFRDTVTDDISFVVVQNPDLVRGLPLIKFDAKMWEAETERRMKEIEDSLYAEFRAYKNNITVGKQKKSCDENPEKLKLTTGLQFRPTSVRRKNGCLLREGSFHNIQHRKLSRARWRRIGL